jgi:alpha-1,2-glucosyltransferase
MILTRELDYVKTAISLATVGLKKPFPILASLVPHFIVLGAFGAFVLWNNGVVLGHKEFHTAGIHLAQMLYIWPYFAFFSWPLFVIPLINILALKPLPEWLNLGLPPKQTKYPRLKAALIVIPPMLAVIHFNTIVHPFTLADNRHYVFYVFRLLLGIHPAVKYAAVLVYFLCGWAVISAFGFTTIQRPPRTLRLQQPPAPDPVPSSTPAPAPSPPAPKPKPKPKPQVHEQPPKGSKKSSKPNQKNTNQKNSTKPEPPASEKTTDPSNPEVLAKVQQHLFTRQRELLEAPRVSFVLIWLVATTLSLVTAPLVEPRYFIIPWVMWRLHLPPLPSLLKHRETRPRTEPTKRNSDFIINSPKFVEMAWFMIINLVTGYVFLYKGFEWPQQPGKIQRFMW